jgi:hypothetical protein
VQGLFDPIDIAVCNDKSQLYIADGGDRYAIWRVNLLNNKQVDKFIALDWKPWSLTVTSSRLLIIPNNGKALVHFSDDGSLLNEINLDSSMWALHAVETTHKTFIVGHCNKRSKHSPSEHKSVSEFDVDGRIIRTFDGRQAEIGPVQFNWPCYLSLYDENHVIVADRDNKRIVVLRSDLQLKRVLIPSLDAEPMQLCLSKSSGLLFINYCSLSYIDIYQVIELL